jgi:hypothetical protein
MIFKRDKTMSEFSDEELEALAGEELPDRSAMSTPTADPSEFVDLELDVPQAEAPPEQ